jgi:hypothetical protein
MISSFREGTPTLRHSHSLLGMMTEFWSREVGLLGISHNYSKKRFLGLKYSWIMILSNKWLMWRNGSHALPKLETSKALGLT